MRLDTEEGEKDFYHVARQSHRESWTNVVKRWNLLRSWRKEKGEWRGWMEDSEGNAGSWSRWHVCGGVWMSRRDFSELFNTSISSWKVGGYLEIEKWWFSRTRAMFESGEKLEMQERHRCSDLFDFQIQLPLLSFSQCSQLHCWMTLCGQRRKHTFYMQLW